MRIIAGELGGRIFASPHGHRTHPMSDKIRGALFNMLGDIDGLSVADPFAGSGALSFEAISRGAASAVAVEHDRGAARTIAENIQSLGLQEQVRLISANAATWLRHVGDTRYDLLLLDPPYDRPPYNLIEKLPRAVRPGGTVVLSWHTDLRLPDMGELELLKNKQYGNASLYIYRALRSMSA